MDITYIQMARGFVYLAVVLDWFSRRVLSWRLSITMEAAFCVETLEDALARHGKPEIFNTDQGSHGAAFTGVLIKNGIAISMDGKGAWRDNIFVERLWRSIKHEEVYLRGYDSVSEACASIGQHAGRRANVGEAYHAHTRRQLSPKQYVSSIHVARYELGDAALGSNRPGRVGGQCAATGGEPASRAMVGQESAREARAERAARKP